MRFRFLLVAGWLAGSLPLVGHAQDAPRFYLGAGANLLTNLPFASSSVPRLVGPALTAGMQLNPKLALQVGVAYHWNSYSFSESYTDPTSPNLALVTETHSYRARYFTVPVLLRYTFSPSAERFHFDGLAGITLLHATNHNTYANNSLGITYSDESDYSATRANLTLGPAIRYAVTSSVELTANGLVSATLGDSYYRFSDRLFLNILVGAHYTFN